MMLCVGRGFLETHKIRASVCVFFSLGVLFLFVVYFVYFVVVFHFLSFPYHFLEQCQELLLKGFRFYSSSTFFVQNAL